MSCDKWMNLRGVDSDQKGNKRLEEPKQNNGKARTCPYKNTYHCYIGIVLQNLSDVSHFLLEIGFPHIPYLDGFTVGRGEEPTGS